MPLSHVLDVAGIHPQARYVVYFSIDPDWWDSIDMADALHPQTFLAYGMNGDELPVGNGGPASHAAPPPARLQEREIHYPPDGHRQPEKIRQGSGLRGSRRRLRLVRRHLTGSFQASGEAGPALHRQFTATKAGTSPRDSGTIAKASFE